MFSRIQEINSEYGRFLPIEYLNKAQAWSRYYFFHEKNQFCVVYFATKTHFI